MNVLLFSLAFALGFCLIMTIFYLGFLGLLLDDYQIQYFKKKRIEPNLTFILNWKTLALTLYVLNPLSKLSGTFAELDEVKQLVAQIKKGRKFGMLVFAIFILLSTLISILIKK